MIEMTTPERARLHQFTRDARADDFDTAEIILIAERALDRGNCLLLRRGTFLRHAEAQQHIRRAAEALHFDVAAGELAHVGADRGNVGGARLGAQFHQCTAGEIDTEIHPERQEQHHRDDRHKRRERITHAAKPHERELGILRGEAQQLHRKTLDRTDV